MYIRRILTFFLALAQDSQLNDLAGQQVEDFLNDHNILSSEVKNEIRDMNQKSSSNPGHGQRQKGNDLLNDR